MNARATFALSALGLLLLAGCGSVEHAPPATLDDAYAQAAARGVPVVLDFFTEW